MFKKKKDPVCEDETAIGEIWPPSIQRYPTGTSPSSSSDLITNMFWADSLLGMVGGFVSLLGLWTFGIFVMAKLERVGFLPHNGTLWPVWLYLGTVVLAEWQFYYFILRKRWKALATGFCVSLVLMTVFAVCFIAFLYSWPNPDTTY